MQEDPVQDTDVTGPKSSIKLSDLQKLNIGPAWSDPKYAHSAKAVREMSRFSTHPGERTKSNSRERARPGTREGSRPGPKRERWPRSADRARPRTVPRPAAPFNPIVDVLFYPEDVPFRALVRAIRESALTYELFQIARLILQKPEWFVIVVRPKAVEEGDQAPLFTAIPDGIPFETEADAINHVLKHHLDAFFTIETVEVEAPKGDFPFISRCSITGELLAPPNYHRYKQILAEHHADRLPHISLDKFNSKIEMVKDPEVVNQWLEKMKQQLRYTFKHSKDDTSVVFDNSESARHHLLTHCKSEMACAGASARFRGTLLDRIPEGNIKRSVMAVLEAQRHYPLETANHLRGHFRKLNFTIYKKGARGVTCLCAIKRKFRESGRALSDSVQSLIDFIEEHPNIPVTRLPEDFLSMAEFEDKKDEREGIEDKTETMANEPEGEQVEAAASNEENSSTGALSADGKEHLNQMRQDLHWLIAEGYVAEFGNGALFAHPARASSSRQVKKRRRSLGKKRVDKTSKPETPPSVEASSSLDAVDTTGAKERQPDTVEVLEKDTD